MWGTETLTLYQTMNSLILQPYSFLGAKSNPIPCPRLHVNSNHFLIIIIFLEKTELFLELFGNSLVRPQASEYLQQKSTEFIRYLVNL